MWSAAREKNLEIIWPYRKGVNRERGGERGGRPRGGREDMRQTERGGKRWWTERKPGEQRGHKGKPKEVKETKEQTEGEEEGGLRGRGRERKRREEEEEVERWLVKGQV